MLLHAFFIFAAINGIMANEIDCSENPEEICAIRYNMEHFTNVMASEEKFKQLCPLFQSYMLCLRNMHRQCRIEEAFSDTDERFEKVINILQEACNENSSLHRGIINNIKCLEEQFNIDDKDCIASASSAFDAYAQNAKKCSEEEESKNRGCLDGSKGFACLAFAAKSNCGQEAKDVMMTLGQRLDWMFLDVPCSEEGIRRVVAAVDAYQNGRKKSLQKRQLDVAIMAGAFGRK